MLQVRLWSRVTPKYLAVVLNSTGWLLTFSFGGIYFGFSLFFVNMTTSVLEELNLSPAFWPHASSLFNQYGSIIPTVTQTSLGCARKWVVLVEKAKFGVKYSYRPMFAETRSTTS